MHVLYNRCLAIILLAGCLQEMLHSAPLKVVLAVTMSIELCGTDVMADVQQQGEDKCDG